MNNKEEIKIKSRLIKRIYKLSKETKKDASYHLNKAIEDYIGEQDDLKEALKRLNDSDDRVISSKQIRNSIGL